MRISVLLLVCVTSNAARAQRTVTTVGRNDVATERTDRGAMGSKTGLHASVRVMEPLGTQDMYVIRQEALTGDGVFRGTRSGKIHVKRFSVTTEQRRAIGGGPLMGRAIIDPATGRFFAKIDGSRTPRIGTLSPGQLRRDPAGSFLQAVIKPGARVRGMARRARNVLKRPLRRFRR